MAASYNVTIGTVTGGSITSDKATAAEGETVTLTVSPNTGYNSRKPTVTKAGGGTVTVSGSGPYTFTMPGEAVTVTAALSKKTYTVTLSESGATGGTLKVDGSAFTSGNTVTHGTHSFEITAPSGYNISSVSGLGSWSVSDGTATLSNVSVTAAATISVTYASSANPALSVSYTGASGASTASSGSVTTSTRHNVTVNFTNQNVLPNGTSYTVTEKIGSATATTIKTGTTSSSGGNIVAKAAGTLTAGTHVFTITANGKSASVTVVVNTSRTLTVNSGTNASVASGGSYTNEFGESASISAAGTYYCNNGTTYSVNYSSGAAYCFTDGTNTDTSKTVSGTISSNTTVSAPTVYEKKYTLTVKQKKGSASATNVRTQTVKYVTTSTVSAPSVTGYTQSNWTVTSGTVYVDGTAKAANSTITAGDIAKVTLRGDATVQANFTETKYKVTLTDATHNATATTNAIGIDTAYSVTAAAKSGYTFSNWTVTGTSVSYVTGSASTATISIKARSAVTLVANYTENKFAVTTAAQKQNNVALGTVTGSGDAGVDTSVAISATPKAGYEFVNWTGSNLTFADANSASTTVTASAAGTATANFRQTRLYVDFSANTTWTTGSSYYKAYFFNNSQPYSTGTNSGSGFVDMTQVPGETYVYYVDIPSGFIDATGTKGFIFLAKSDNNNDWNNKKDQTADLAFVENKNRYVIAANTSNNSWDATPYFPPATNQVTISAGANGKVTFNGSTEIAANSSSTVSVGNTAMSVVATPNSGYTFDSWTASSGVTLGSSASTASNTVTATADGTLSATFTAISHNITKTESHATITVTGGKTSAATGETVTFTVAPAQNYYLASGAVQWRMGTGSWTTLTASNGTYSLTVTANDNPSDAIQIKATGSETKHTVTVTTDGNGTVNAASKSVGAVTAVALPTPTASYGYKFAGWEVTTGSVIVGSTTYTAGSANAVFSTNASTSIKVTADATVRANFTYNDSMNLYIVGRFRVYDSTHTTPTYVGGSSGAWSTTGTQIPFTYDSTGHYYYVETNSTLAEVSASLSDKQYFRVYDGSNTWQLKTNDKALKAADAGERFAMASSGDKSFYFDETSNPNGPVTICFDPTTQELWYTIPSTHTATVGTITGNGTVTLNGNASAAVSEGISYSIVATPATGYKLTALAVNGTSVIGSNSGKTEPVTVTHAMGTADETVTATFTAVDYTVSTSVKPDGVDSGNTVKVNNAASLTGKHIGDTITVTVTPAAGYAVDNVKYGSTPITMTNNSGTFTMPAENTTVTATFKAATPSVSLGAITSDHGTIGNNYYAGDTFKVTPTVSGHTTVTYKLVNTSTQAETNISDISSFIVGDAGTYKVVATATNTRAGVTAATATAETSAFTTVATDTTGSRNIDYYIDFHNNEVTGSPTIKLGSNTAVTLTKVTSANGANIYHAQAATPYVYNGLIDSSGVTAIRDIAAVITANEDSYDMTIDKSVINSTSTECWIESLGTPGSYEVTFDSKTQINQAVDTYRIYFSTLNDSNEGRDKAWGVPKIYYTGGSTSVNWDQSPEMTYTGGFGSGKDWMSVYYYDVPADTTTIVFRSNDGTYQTTDVNSSYTYTGAVGGSYIQDGMRFYIKDDGNGNWSYNNGKVNYDLYKGSDNAGPQITQYYDNIKIATGVTSDYAVVTGFTKTIVVESSDTSVIRVNVDNTITGIAPGTATLTAKAYGDVGVTNDDQSNNYREVTINVTVGDNESIQTGGYAVMSFESTESTISATGASEFNVATTLVGSKSGGNASTSFENGGIVTTSGTGASTVYTVKYAKANSTLGYGGLGVNAVVTSTPQSSYYFKDWSGTASNVANYTKANTTLSLLGGTYVLTYELKASNTYTINYKYKEYDLAKAGTYIYDDGVENAGSAEDVLTAEKIYTVSDINIKDDDFNNDIQGIILDNAPTLTNNYYNYKIVMPTTSLGTTTINVTMNPVVRNYKLTLNGKIIGRKYHYQTPVKLTPALVAAADNIDTESYRFKDFTWKVDGKLVATGNTYDLYITKDTIVTGALNDNNSSASGTSVVTNSGYQLTLNDQNVQKLYQEFYIEDFYDNAVHGEDAQFLGGGTIFYSVDAKTGAPLKTKAVTSGVVSDDGIADTSKLKSMISRVVTNTDAQRNAAADSETNLTISYSPREGGTTSFIYSEALQAYHYIYSLGFTNKSSNSGNDVRLYSYYIYRVGNETKVVVSDSYASAAMYVEG